MTKKAGLSFGSLRQKILNLVLIILLLVIGLFALVSMFTSKILLNVAENSVAQQKHSITQVSNETMSQVLDVTMTQSTQMQANIADSLFSEARGNVLTMAGYAEYLFTHRDEFEDKPAYDPIRENDGVPSVQLQHEAAVDPASDPDLGLIANMSELLLLMYSNSEVLNSCLIATTNGTILFCDDRAGANFDVDGNLETFEVRSRPWYTGAINAGELYYTSIELDAFTNIPGIVCAAPVFANGKLVAVAGADIFLTQISKYVSESAKNGGFVCIVNENGEIVFSPKMEGTFKAVTSDQTEDLRSGENKALADFVTRALKENTEIEMISVDGKDYYFCGAPMKSVGWTVISAFDKSLSDQPTRMMLEAYDNINRQALHDYQASAAHSQRVFLVCTLLLLILSVAGAIAVAGRIVKPIARMTQRIGEISGTDITFKMEDTYRTGDEIEVLAEAFATLSERTCEYIAQITRITAEKERIGAELALATKIQADMLPNIFPAFPNRPEFDIYASMTPAKEVGGDFYDFFLIDDDHLGMVMADVSGKGVPAALFMMMSKILVNNFAMLGNSPAKALEMVNAQVCKNNDEEMFVTVWLGVLEISTGTVTAANAGHEYPMIRKANGDFELFKDHHGFVIGGMDGVKYNEYQFTLEKGGTLFLYTDGVAEATNKTNELFGTDRMIAALNQNADADPKTLLQNMKEAVDAFVGDSPQFDDLTMLSVKLL